jgi:hypothetical protein
MTAIRLAELEARFVKILPPDAAGHAVFQTDVPIAEADGVLFLCPTCFRANGGRVGTHSVLCWRPHVPQDRSPTPGRWELVGTGLGNLSLSAGSSSIHLQSGCGAHFFVRDGEIASA